MTVFNQSSAKGSLILLTDMLAGFVLSQLIVLSWTPFDVRPTELGKDAVIALPGLDVDSHDRTLRVCLEVRVHLPILLKQERVLCRLLTMAARLQVAGGPESDWPDVCKVPSVHPARRIGIQHLAIQIRLPSSDDVEKTVDILLGKVKIPLGAAP